MDEDQKNSWRRFQRLSFDSKHVRKRAKKMETATLRHARKFIAKRLDSVSDVRRHILLWIASVIGLIVAVGIQQIGFQYGYKTTASANGGTYAEATLGDIKTLNPLYATTSSEVSVSRLVFSSLLSYDTSGHIANDVAEKVQTSEDGLHYTVSLRRGVRWHDGAHLTAKDVLFTTNLIKSPATRSALQLQWQDVKVSVLDDYTVRFSLPSTYAAFPHALTFPILPEHILKDVEPQRLRENAFSLSPVGSGPFEMKLLQPLGNSKIANLSAFDDYFRGKPKLSRLEIHGFMSQDDIIEALQAKRVTATSDVDDTSWLEEAADYRAKAYPVYNGTYAFFNTSQPTLKEKNVRRALQMAVNINKVREKTQSTKYPLNGPLVPSQLEGDDVPILPPQNIVEAKRLLDEAGWKQQGDYRMKDGQRLTLSLVSTNQTNFVESAKLLATAWREVGVDVKLEVVDPADPMQDFTQNILQMRSYDVLVYELAIGADPDVYAFWHSSQAGQRGLNLSLYSNPVSDDALTSARARTEPELRNIKYKTFVRQWIDDMPAIPLFQSSVKYISSRQATTLADDQQLVSPYDRYANVIYWSDGKDTVYKTP